MIHSEIILMPSNGYYCVRTSLHGYSFIEKSPRYIIFVVFWTHQNDVIMSAMVSQMTRLTIVYSTVYSGADQRKHQRFASLAFMRGIHRWPVNSPHKGPVTQKIFPFDDVIMIWYEQYCDIHCTLENKILITTDDVTPTPQIRIILSMIIMLITPTPISWRKGQE